MKLASPINSKLAGRLALAAILVVGIFTTFVNSAQAASFPLPGCRKQTYGDDRGWYAVFSHDDGQTRYYLIYKPDGHLPREDNRLHSDNWASCFAG